MLLVALRVNAVIAIPGEVALRYLCSAFSGVIDPDSISA